MMLSPGLVALKPPAKGVVFPDVVILLSPREGLTACFDCSSPTITWGRLNAGGFASSEMDPHCSDRAGDEGGTWSNSTPDGRTAKREGGI